MKEQNPALDLVGLGADPASITPWPGTDDELDLLAIEELEPRLTPDHLLGALPVPTRTVGWGC